MAKLLIVDDEFRIRELIKKYAVYEGHEVDEAQDGEQAVLKCRNNTYDLIILDIMMPKLDGFAAAAAIRRFSSTPIIMLSAKGEEYDRLSGFEAGVDDYVVKPFSPKELMMRVSAVLRRAAERGARRQSPDTAPRRTRTGSYTRVWWWISPRALSPLTARE